MDLQQAFDAGFEAVKGYLDRELEAFERRLIALESRQLVKGEKGDPGEPGAAGDRGEKGDPGERGEPGPKGEPGPAGADGRDGADAAPVTREMILDAIKADPDLIREAVAMHMKEHPPAPGNDGRDGRDGVDGAPGRDGLNGEKGEPGRDGVGLAGALIDRDGQLVVTLTDGSAKELGVIVGKDGADGAPGRDGADGLGFDDITFEYDGERTLSVVCGQGERAKRRDFVMPIVIDRGPYREGTDYVRGDVVSFGGSMWIAQSDTGAKPGTGDEWRLSVKRGRDGREVVAVPPSSPKPVRV